ncbi:MAG: clostripain-related cysteine peptidase [Treponema sp.]|nr:clostripain-related cysteine peptidase [Treponema sp.]
MKKLLFVNLILIILSGCNNAINVDIQGNDILNDYYTDTQTEPAPAPPFIPPSLTLEGLPVNIISDNFSGVFVYNVLGKVAQCSDIKDIVIVNDGVSASAVIPLVYTEDRNRYFYENGLFTISFTVTVDAVSQIVRSQSDNITIPFINGCSSHNLNNEPAPVMEPPFIPPSLTLKGLPKNIIAENFSGIFIYNALGKIAQCSDFRDIVIGEDNDFASAVIPLVYSIDTERYFYENGQFAVSFNITIDMITQIIREKSDGIMVIFTNGSGEHDINNEPAVIVEPPFIPPSISIRGLPKNIIKSNFSNIFIYNAQGRVAQCSGYQDIIITSDNNFASAVIPLVYSGNTGEYFYETGDFAVSFTVTIDIRNQIIISQSDNCIVPFLNGCAEFNLADKREPEPEPQFIPPSLTIRGLPQNIIYSNFSNIYVYNMLGRVAQCPDIQDITIINDINTSTAIIPLVYTSDTGRYFYESGEFSISFTVTKDAVVQITRSQSGNHIIEFYNGCSVYDLSSEPKIVVEPVDRKWTFIVYMAADNDLESAAITDINEMEAAKFDNAPVSVLVLIDRNPGYDMTNGNWSDTRVYEIKTDNNGMYSNIVSNRLDCPELGLYTYNETELNTADPNVLSGFINFAKREYPADKYALFVWGHGTGWRADGYHGGDSPLPLKAVAFDDTNGSQYMSLPAFGRAVNGKGLSVIAFDTCYAALLEIAYQIRYDAELFVGSTGPIMSTGWDYNVLFTDFIKKPGLSVNDLGNSIQSQFSSQYASLNFATISQIRLSQVNNLFEKFEAFAGAVASAITSESSRNNVRTQVLNNIESYYFASFPTDLYIDISDFRQKINNIRTSITSDTALQNAINTASGNLDNALSSAVISSWANNGTTKKIGVHVIPLQSAGVPSVSHESAYIRGSMVLDKSNFVNSSRNWVPNTVPQSNSLLDKLFYWAF